MPRLKKSALKSQAKEQYFCSRPHPPRTFAPTLASRLSVVGCCVFAFFVGLLFVQRSGNYFVTMFDDYSATLPLTVIVILENVAVAWIYGTKK